LNRHTQVNAREDTPPGIITRCLTDWKNGDEEALDRLTTAVYRELRRLAGAAMMGDGRKRTLQPTALVHELYFQLPGVRHFDWQSRAHFLNVAAKMMRNILAGHARKRLAAKRGGGMTLVIADPEFEDAALSVDVLRIHEALDRFMGEYPRQARVVELRFFGGLSAEETSEVLNATGGESSLRTVERDWTFARAWLESAIGGR
jgi:RNA polymerase sigma factor (TIGR02999 family)